MPYIDFDTRGKIATTIPEGLTPGCINFLICDLVDQWIGPAPNYERLNAAIGIMECAKLELYRRVAVPYEDKKILQNGDVFMERE